MENYPSNSNRVAAKKPARRPPETAEKREKKVEKVVVGDVKRRKKPLGKKFSETFVGGDAHSVWGYILYDVMLPSAKDMVADAVSQGIERMLFGETRGRSRSVRSGGYTSYNKISTAGRRPDDRRELSHRARAQHDFDEIVLESRAEADEVLDALFTLVSDYDVATVGDLYELVGQTGNFTDDKWGWVDLRGASVTRVKGGYLLNLPRPEYID